MESPAKKHRRWGSATGSCPFAATAARREIAWSTSVGRYYDSQTGQFISVDPLVDTTDAPYAYASGNPVTGVDPSGLEDRTTPHNQAVDATVGAIAAWCCGLGGWRQVEGFGQELQMMMAIHARAGE